MRRTSKLRVPSWALLVFGAAVIASCGRVVAGDGLSADDGGVGDGASRDSGELICSAGSIDVNGMCEPSPISDASTGSIADADASDAMDILAPCLIGGNRFFIAGDDSPYSGPPLSLGPNENWLGGDPDYAIDGQATAVSIQVWDHGPGPLVNDFNFELSTANSNVPIEVHDYPSIDTIGNGANAELELTGPGSGCDHVSGDVHVYEITSTANDASESDLHSFTATFVQHCDRKATYNYGCVHVENCRSGSCPPFSGDP